MNETNMPCAFGEMKIPLLEWFRISSFGFRVFLPLLFASLACAHESPIDHVDRTLQLYVKDSRLYVSYRLRQTDRAAFLQLRAMDRDRDGRVSRTERERFLNDFAKRLSKQLAGRFNNAMLRFRPVGAVKLHPDFSQSFLFAAKIGNLPPGEYHGRLTDYHSRSYPGSFMIYQGHSSARSALKISRNESKATQGHSRMLVVNFVVRIR